MLDRKCLLVNLPKSKQDEVRDEKKNFTNQDRVPAHGSDDIFNSVWHYFYDTWEIENDQENYCIRSFIAGTRAVSHLVQL